MQSNSNNSKKAIERIRVGRQDRDNVEGIFDGLRQGRRDALGKAITWVESNNTNHFEKTEKLLALCLPHTGNSWRIGITGVPGVGKSTFIETFGMALIARGKKVAVLAIDPSSQLSKGSILGDKTRMDELSKHEMAFVRPSPASDTLGGVTRATRESILLCEAAGFDVILVETVGVGQSETAVNGMVDFFLLLLLAGAGDELQGIKRGIMEMADAVLITKADGENIAAAKKASTQIKSALHLFPSAENGWTPKVDICSAIERLGIESFIDSLHSYFNHITHTGWILENRMKQDIDWLHEAIRNEILHQFKSNPDNLKAIAGLENDVKNKIITPFAAARKVVSK